MRQRFDVIGRHCACQSCSSNVQNNPEHITCAMPFAMPVAQESVMRRRSCACNVSACCDDNPRNLRCVGESALALCAPFAMAVAPQLATQRRPCACNVRACCEDGRTTTCDALAILRLQCARMLRCRPRRNSQCIGDSALAV